MFRLSKTDQKSPTVVTLEGQLAGDFCIEVVENCCNQAISTGKRVEVCFRNVATVDEGGRAMLLRLAAKGVRFRGNGFDTSHLVRRLSPAPSKAAAIPGLRQGGEHDEITRE